MFRSEIEVGLAYTPPCTPSRLSGRWASGPDANRRVHSRNREILTICEISHIARYNVYRRIERPGPRRCAMPDSLRRFKAGIFQALAHPTRIAIVELLRDEGEVPVARIYEQLGLEQANASRHLAVLRSKQIVIGRKNGNQVFYSLRDPILGKVLDLMRQYFQANLSEALDMLRGMDTEHRPPK